jgi:hypothetical protein
VIFVLIRQLRKKGSLKGMLFGGKIKRYMEPVNFGKSGFFKSFIRVNTISTDQEDKIALEVVYKSDLIYQLTPVTLSKSEAQTKQSIGNRLPRQGCRPSSQ